jgi:hypothetical protein
MPQLGSSLSTFVATEERVQNRVDRMTSLPFSPNADENRGFFSESCSPHVIGKAGNTEHKLGF